MFIPLPPANEVCEGYVLTGVCLSTGEVSASSHAGIHTPPGRHPSGQTPPGQRPPWADTPLGRHPPSTQCMLGYSQQVGGTHPTGIQSYTWTEITNGISRNCQYKDVYRKRLFNRKLKPRFHSWRLLHFKCL